MAFIYYTVDGYDGDFAYLNTDGEMAISCSITDLIRCSITVGNPTVFSWKRIKEEGLVRAFLTSVMEKAIQTYCNLHVSGNSIALHQTYFNLVQDKKRDVSYNLGMALSKFHAEKLLGIPNLIHVQFLKKTHVVQILHDENGNRLEPDLLGVSPDGSWHVFEAKGSPYPRLPGLIQEAKMQAERIETIAGQTPATTSACASHFSNSRIVSRISDPKPKGSWKIEVDRMNIVKSRTKSFFWLGLATKQKPKLTNIDGVRFYELEFSNKNLDFSLGLESELYESEGEIDVTALGRMQSRLSDLSRFDATDVSIGLDGWIVRLR